MARLCHIQVHFLAQLDVSKIILIVSLGNPMIKSALVFICGYFLRTSAALRKILGVRVSLWSGEYLRYRIRCRCLDQCSHFGSCGHNFVSQRGRDDPVSRIQVILRLRLTIPLKSSIARESFMSRSSSSHIIVTNPELLTQASQFIKDGFD